MARLHYILLLFSISTLCDAQSIEKRYSSHISNTGVINFFHPQKLKNSTNVNMFVYDMTYISYSDSVTLNCSYRIQNGSSIKYINLKNGNDDIRSNNVSVLYREVLKYGYEIRITSRFSFNDIKNIFSSQTPLIFEIVLSDGSCYTASYHKSVWKKERANITRILESINF